MRRARVLHRRLDVGLVELGAAREQLVVAPELAAARCGRRRPRATASSSSAPTSSISGMPGLHDADRAAVRVAAGDRRRALTTATTPGLDQAVGGDPVEVAVVDDRDLAGLEPLDQVLGAPVDPGRALDRERRVGLLAERGAGPSAAASRAARRRGRLRCRAARRRGGGRGESPTPASIRDSSATRVVAVDDRVAVRHRALLPCSTRSTAFSTTTCVSANAATCARWVTHSTWCRDPSVCSRRPTAAPGLAADPGVDLVEHQGRRRLREHHTRRQHRTGELAAGRGLGQRPGRLARVGRQEEGDPVGAVVGRLARLDLDVDRPRAASPARAGAPSTARAERRGRVAAGRARASAAAASAVALVLGAPRLELGRALLVALELVEAGRGLGAVGDHLGEGLAVLAAQLAELVPAGAHRRRAAAGSSSTRSTSRRSSCSRSASSACAPRRRAASSANGARPSSAASAAPSASRPGPRARRTRRSSASRCATASASSGSSASSATSSSGSSSRGGADLVDLEAEQVDLAGTGACVAAERGELGVERRAPRRAPRGSAASASSAGAPGEAVERAALHRGIEQRLVRVLAVQVDERAPGLGELADGRQAAVDVRAAAPVARHDPRRARSRRRSRDPRTGLRPAPRRRRRARARRRRARRRAARAPRPAASCPRRSRR